ncbi:MAG: Arm DNA-binding domain-containing protein [Gallionellaceae bacterium]
MQGIRRAKSAWQEAFRRWGLYLLITPAGSASWRIKYRIDGKEKTYSIGNYPEVSLAAARVELGEVKALLRENKDPVTQRRINRAETSASSDNTFEAVAGVWLTDLLRI